MLGIAKTTSGSILGVIRRNPGFWITLKFSLPLLKRGGIKETAVKLNMVTPPGEQHGLGRGLQALTAF